MTKVRSPECRRNQSLPLTTLPTLASALPLGPTCEEKMVHMGSSCGQQVLGAHPGRQSCAPHQTSTDSSLATVIVSLPGKGDFTDVIKERP